jgi:hypothetical protein
VRIRRRAVTLALAAVTLAGCTSTQPSRTATPSRSPGGSSTGSSRTAAPSSLAGAATLPAGAPTAAARLDARLRAGVPAIRSVHLEIRTTTAGQTIVGTGDERLENGTPLDLHLTETVTGATSFELILIGDKTYAKLPPSLYKTTKPWVLISADSPTAAIKQLAATIASTKSTASLNTITQFVAAARSIRDTGSHLVGGVRATHYSVTVSTAKLPASFPGRSELAAAGLATVPVEIDVDAAGRPVRISETVTTGGQTVSTTITLSRFDQPLSIIAPPAAQVGTK